MLTVACGADTTTCKHARPEQSRAHDRQQRLHCCKDAWSMVLPHQSPPTNAPAFTARTPPNHTCASVYRLALHLILDTLPRRWSAPMHASSTHAPAPSAPACITSLSPKSARLAEINHSHLPCTAAQPSRESGNTARHAQDPLEEEGRESKGEEHAATIIHAHGRGPRERAAEVHACSPQPLCRAAPPRPLPSLQAPRPSLQLVRKAPRCRASPSPRPARRLPPAPRGCGQSPPGPIHPSAGALWWAP